MPRFQIGRVVRILESRDGVVRALVEVTGDRERRATAFTQAIGPLAEGDPVVVNTTARDLELGTGGEDFVLWNLARTSAGTMSGGHVLKLRYTPWQVDALVAEAPESPSHDTLAAADSLEGMPVVACALHSQLAPVGAVLKARRPDLVVAHVMTDGAALPIGHSDLVALLKERKILDATITCGHAFGGDLEAVNVFSGLAAARWVAQADVAVVCVGPGIVGTGTLLGHTGMDQGVALSAAAALGGGPVAALRISFADPRERHRVVSHHSLAALTFGVSPRCMVAVPRLEPDRLEAVLERLARSGVAERHDLRVVDAAETLEALESFELRPTTMGRSVAEDPDFFVAAGAAALVALDMLEARP